MADDVREYEDEARFAARFAAALRDALPPGYAVAAQPGAFALTITIPVALLPDTLRARGDATFVCTLGSARAAVLAGHNFAALVAVRASSIAEALSVDSGGKADDWAAVGPGLRVQLRHPIGREAIPEQLTEEQYRRLMPVQPPWQGGLHRLLCVDRPSGMLYASPGDCARWGTTAEEALARGMAQTAAALRDSPASYRSTAHGLDVVIFDNDLPGYTATRLLFPDLVAPAPGAGRWTIAAIPDRDFLIAISAEVGPDLLTAVALIAATRNRRAGEPYTLLPLRLFVRRDAGDFAPITEAGVGAQVRAGRRERRRRGGAG